MKKIILLSLFMTLLFFNLNAQTNVGSLLDLYNVRDNLTASYNQTANIDLSPTDPANVSLWSSGTSYVEGDYVKYDDGGTTYTYICIQATSSQNPTNTSYWKQLWESDKGWKPIGFDSNNSGSPQFEGNYDGQGYTISNLYINRPTQQNVGLFSHLGYDGDGVEISDVGLLEVDIKGARGTGSLVGRVTGNGDNLIELSFARNGTVVGDGATGGLVGSNNSYLTSPANKDEPVISKCYANIDVSWSQNYANYENYNDDSDWTDNDNYADKFGGLVGCNQKGITQNSYALGDVTVINNETTFPPSPINDKNYERVGGLAGCTFLKGNIINSYSAGLVTTQYLNRFGGLVGYVGFSSERGKVDSCFWDTQTSGQSTSAGGTGKTTTQMKTQSTFTSAGWDFTNTWEIVGNNYPRLQDNPDPTLPVVLSTFVAQYVNNMAQLHWVTQTETDNIGWNVYRGEENDFTASDRINNTLIEGFGTTTIQHEYNFTDNTAQLLAGETYYYWIENLDLGGKTDIHGPAEMYISPSADPGNIPPEQEFDGLYNVVNNPFNPTLSNTGISFSLPQNSRVELNIYNAKGQLIRNLFSGVTSNKENCVWDGMDENRIRQSAGIYLFSLNVNGKIYDTQKVILMR